MISGIFASLAVAWFFNLFGAANVVLELLQPIFSTVVLTEVHYYAIAGVIGFIGGAISKNS